MGFMEREIVKGDWYEIDGHCGIAYVPVDIVGSIMIGDAEDLDRETMERINDFYEGGSGAVWRVDILNGQYGARLSAPGYLDCTEWCVFASRLEAEAYLDEAYGDDEGDDA